MSCQMISATDWYVCRLVQICIMNLTILPFFLHLNTFAGIWVKEYERGRKPEKVLYYVVLFLEQHYLTWECGPLYLLITDSTGEELSAQVLSSFMWVRPDWIH